MAEIFPLQNLQNNINDIKALLDVTTKTIDLEKQVIFRSAIVLLLASFEQFIEQLSNESIDLLSKRMRNSTNLPKKVKQKIATNTIVQNTNNLKEYSDSIWSFSDDGWKENYKKYCKKLTDNFHSPSSYNIENLFENLFGIKSIGKNWIYKDYDCKEKLKEIIDIRHKIAHGDTNFSKSLNFDTLSDYIKFIKSISEQIYNIVNNKIIDISIFHGKQYSLRDAYVLDIINYVIENDLYEIPIDDFKNIGSTSSAQGNHNKLCYKPWNLLEKKKGVRIVTQTLHDFYNNKTKLPLEILVFNNQEAIPNLNTQYISFSELNNLE